MCIHSSFAESFGDTEGCHDDGPDRRAQLAELTPASQRGKERHGSRKFFGEQAAKRRTMRRQL
jgi:hypothetical protein